SSRRRHTRSKRDWSSDVCSSDLFPTVLGQGHVPQFSAIAGVERGQGLVLGHEYGAVVFADDVRGVGVGDGGVAGIGVECRTGPVDDHVFLGWCDRGKTGALIEDW